MEIRSIPTAEVIHWAQRRTTHFYEFCGLANGKATVLRYPCVYVVHPTLHTTTLQRQRNKGSIKVTSEHYRGIVFNILDSLDGAVIESGASDTRHRKGPLEKCSMEQWLNTLLLLTAFLRFTERRYLVAFTPPNANRRSDIIFERPGNLQEFTKFKGHNNLFNIYYWL